VPTPHLCGRSPAVGGSPPRNWLRSTDGSEADELFGEERVGDDDPEDR
jgi:hypothetical protein